ncbi:hypothetical protein J8L88_09890 [Aquimarina sp. MMG015]|uniref:hypothetical protein n=1 Tax=Aquimarina sp. MMG015 TaxID=2822689 RepID=UPI001B3A5D98|nr:hypothetical protein [Aquimarina sp. MMG015]MBQ4803159.1 hypothetical protein [Aquimarina sp. MMG015]
MTTYQVTILILNLLFVIAALAWMYFQSFLKAKGKNLATKQDIADITRKVESVKLEYLRQIEDYKKDLEIRYSLEPTILKTKISVYETTTTLLKVIFARKNNIGNESQLNQQIFNDILKLIIIINSNFKLREFLKDEIKMLQEEHNKIMEYIDHLKQAKQETYEIKLDLIIEGLEDLQQKIVQ